MLEMFLELEFTLTLALDVPTSGKCTSDVVYFKFLDRSSALACNTETHSYERLKAED